MAELLSLSKLSDDELRMINAGAMKLARRGRKYHEMDLRYKGQWHVEQMGVSVPAEFRRFEFALNWCRVNVDARAERMEVKRIVLPGEPVTVENGQTVPNSAIAEGWDANSMDLQAPLAYKESMTHGRSFVTVSTNAEDRDHPLITVESAKSLAETVDPVTRRIKSAVRLYSDPDMPGNTIAGTLYLPNETVWYERKNGRFTVTDRDPHKLTRVPVIMHLNRQLAGQFEGQSEMADLIGITDMAARVLMNSQFAAETMAAPHKWLANLMPEGFLNPDGTPKVNLDPSLDGIWTFFQAKGQSIPTTVGSFASADLDNYAKLIAMLGQLGSSVTGLPLRNFGQNPANPASEGGIRSEESRFVKDIEGKEVSWGRTWGWTANLYERIRTGEWVTQPGRIACEWHDPGTPTFAQKADAIQKLAGGKSILSREGAWDEMGWSEERKGVERAYFAAEASDPELDKRLSDLGAGSATLS